MALLSEQTDPRFIHGRRNIFGANLITWQPGDIQKLVEVGRRVPEDSLLLENNLWWSPESADALAKLGPFPGAGEWDQVIDVDPLLNEKLQPQAPAAVGFGSQRRLAKS
jgi:hypothetical protein